MIRITPNVYGVHEVREHRMNECIKQIHWCPVDEWWNWLQFLEFGALFIERHRYVEENVEEHRHRHEHHVHFQVAFVDLRLIATRKHSKLVFNFLNSISNRILTDALEHFSCICGNCHCSAAPAGNCLLDSALPADCAANCQNTRFSFGCFY